MSLFIIRTLFTAELRMVLRDRRILLTSLILPLLITPVMFLGSSWSIHQRERTLREMTFRYAVIASQAIDVRALVAAAKELQSSPSPSQADSGETRLTHKSRLKPEKVARGFNFEEKACEDALAALTKGEVQSVLQGSKASQDDSTAPSQAAPKVARKQTTSGRPQSDDGEAAIPGVPIIRILYRADRDESVAALARMQSSLHRVRAAQRTK